MRHSRNQRRKENSHKAHKGHKVGGGRNRPLNQESDGLAAKSAKGAKKESENVGANGIRPLQPLLRESAMKIIKISSALKGLKKINDEIRYADCFKEERFTSGLIAFRPSKKSDPKKINHDDKDVVCQVIKGSGRLRVNGKRIPLRPGIVCHIPKGTPHDFAAGRSSELVMFYSLIKT